MFFIQTEDYVRIALETQNDKEEDNKEQDDQACTLHIGKSEVIYRVSVFGF